MGKKARKTRWRTLSIGENPSDSESQPGEGTKSYVARGRWAHGGGVSGAHPKYNSSHSTPTRQYTQYNYHTKYGGDSNTKWGPTNRTPHPVVSTRSSSTASDNKITFNEDEYTKITTPRQDVLFKKGYLNKPKPYLQRPLTSAGNSTGDGTPDHQSADGADYPENDLEPLHWAPHLNSIDPGLYYLNYDSMYFVDQFGAPTLCYPPHGVLHPSTQFYTPNGAQQPRGEKRYSVDSLTESSSPNNESNVESNNESNNESIESIESNELNVLNESNESNIDSNLDSNETEANLDSEEVFEGAKVFPKEEISEEEPENEEKKSRKKRRRRKTETDDTENNSVAIKTKYSVDAQEFIPRGFAPGPPTMNFVPFVPHEMFPGAYVLLGPAIGHPHFYPQHQMISGALQEDYAPEKDEDGEEDEEEYEEEPLEDKEVVGGQPQAIDIAKIVSKLEQAALEQKLLEEKEIKENNDKPEVKIVEEDVIKVIKVEERREEENTAVEIIKKGQEVQEELKEMKRLPRDIKTQLKPENNCIKTDQMPLRPARYSDRLKTSQGTPKKPSSGGCAPIHTSISSINSSTSPNISIPPINSSIPPIHTSIPPTNTSTPPKPTPIPPPSNKPPQKSISTKPRPLSSTPRALCPRLERTAAPKPLSTLPHPPSTQNPPIGATDQWISVSGKKKRKNNKITTQELSPDIRETQEIQKIQDIQNIQEIQNIQGIQNIQEIQKIPEIQEILPKTKKTSIDLSESFSETPKELLEDPVEAVKAAIEVINAQPIENIPNILKSHPEMAQRANAVQETEKNKKDRTNKSSEKKRLIKKRIIITDRPLQDPVGQLSSTPIISTEAEILLSPKLGVEAIKTLKNDVKEVKKIKETNETNESKETKVPISEKISATPAIEITPLRDSTPELQGPKVVENEKESKKSKKKKNKSSKSSLNEVLNSSLSSIEGDALLGAQLDSQETTEDQDVSLELERMIQRGLYANLEQRLQTFNPGDSFLTAFQGSAPTVGPLFVPTKPKTTSILPFPPIIIPPNVTISPENNISPILETTPQEANNTAVGPQIGLSITQAVKDWMVRTRENTPEVEIFKRPQELRSEVLNKVLDLEEGNLTNLEQDLKDLEENFEDSEGISEDEVQVHQEVVTYEEEVDRSAQEALETKTRFEEGDLVPSSDYEHSNPEVECAEDALNFQSGALGPSRPRRGHGGLPYRAICCTVM